MSGGDAQPICTSTVAFKVRRSEPELVGPAKPTPREVKRLSDIDDQPHLRFLTPGIYFCRHNPSMQGKDPARVIRDALAQALVPYYPLAGRLIEGPDRKVSVDCTGEGIFFVEAEADVELAHFGDQLHPPFPCIELIYDANPFDDFLNSPLMFIQVTRLKCEGFTLGVRLNHGMSDGQGSIQFLTAVGEIARGARAPSIAPVWRRELFNARDPPRVTCSHLAYDKVENPPPAVFYNHPDVAHRSFFFGPSQLLAIRRLLPPQRSTAFEVLTACLFRCYVAALRLDEQEKVILSCMVTARGRFGPSVVPVGYYGNAFAFPSAATAAGELCGRPLEYAVGLVKKVTGEFSEEYMHSLADLMAITGREIHPPGRVFSVSDLRRVEMGGLDFGWGKPVYSGVPRCEFQGITYYLPFKNKDGEDGILVPLCITTQAMDRFESELNKLLTAPSTHV